MDEFRDEILQREAVCVRGPIDGENLLPCVCSDLCRKQTPPFAYSQVPT